jgi:hypothetical protein
MAADWLPKRYRVVDPLTGTTTEEGERSAGQPVGNSGSGPRLVIFYDGPESGWDPRRSRGVGGAENDASAVR